MPYGSAAVSPATASNIHHISFTMENSWTDAAVDPGSNVELVIMNADNTSITDRVYGPLDIRDILQLASTCRKARFEWMKYRGRVYNMNKFLALYLKDTTGFRRLMRASDSMIVGPCLSDFLWRRGVGTYSLSVVLAASALKDMKEHLERVEGFTVWEGNRPGYAELEANIASTLVRPSKQGRYDLRSAYLSTSAVKSQENPFTGVLTMEHRAPSGKIIHIVMAVARTSIIKSVLSPFNSASF